MSRTPNPRRPADLINKIVAYLTKHGLADLSLRPLAKAVGSSPRVLLYYFGSKERLVVSVLKELRGRQLADIDQITTPRFEEACIEVWDRISAPDSEPFFRLFFEAYGIALRRPRLYREFLESAIEDWLAMIAGPLRNEGFTASDADAFATLILGGLRGFMLDYCNTKDRKRVDSAVRMWASGLDDLLARCKRTASDKSRGGLR